MDLLHVTVGNTYVLIIRGSHLLLSHDLFLVREGKDSIPLDFFKPPLAVMARHMIFLYSRETAQLEWSLINVCRIELIYSVCSVVYFCKQMDESCCAGDYANICRCIICILSLS